MTPMTLNEMWEWIKTAQYIETQEIERDDEDIIWSMEVYQKDGQFYLVEREEHRAFIPIKRYPTKDKSLQRYLPVLAKKASWMEYRHCFEPAL